VCWFIPHTSLVADVCAALLVIAALAAMALGMAHLATLDVPAREGDVLEWRNGRGRVRAVRLYYTVVDTFDRATVLVPNSRICADREASQAHRVTVCRASLVDEI
jgi:small-conductance mechanosensitive channel